MQKNLTTDDLRETKQHGFPGFPLQFYMDDTRDFYNSQVSWHWHNEFEIVLVSEGTVIFHIGQHTLTLQAGEAIFINSRILHQFTAENYGILPNIVFAPEFIAPSESVIYQKYIAPVEKSTLEYLVLQKECDRQARILELLEILFQTLASEKYHELQVRNLLSEVWLMMTEQIPPAIEKEPHKGRKNFSYNSVMVMIQYIQSHYMETICLEDIAASANISKNTAIRYFHANIGMSPIDYLLKCRISIACKMLRETSDKISHIANSVGYENTGYFCRLFRRHTGLSPNEYRRL